MNVIGLSRLKAHGAVHPKALPELAALAAFLRAAPAMSADALASCLPNITVTTQGPAIDLLMSTAGCRITLLVDERLQTVHVAKVVTKDRN
jgi:hypothetical protein